MKVRYFIVDAQQQLRKAEQAAVKGLWEGLHGADVLGSPARQELRLTSVVCDDSLLPEKVFFLRLPLTEGQFREENYLTLQLFARPDCVTPHELAQHHTDGWPTNFFHQLAVALDVPMASLNVPLGIGGPLLTAAAMRVSPRQALRYLP